MLYHVDQKGGRSFWHDKDLQIKIEHPPSGFCEAPGDFDLQSTNNFLRCRNISIVATLDLEIMLDKLTWCVLRGLSGTFPP